MSENREVVLSVDLGAFSSSQARYSEEDRHEPSPCDDCRLRDACAQNQFACEDLHWNIRSGEVLCIDRRPSGRIWNQIAEISQYGD